MCVGVCIFGIVCVYLVYSNTWKHIFVVLQSVRYTRMCAFHTCMRLTKCFWVCWCLFVCVCVYIYIYIYIYIRYNCLLVEFVGVCVCVCVSGIIVYLYAWIWGPAVSQVHTDVFGGTHKCVFVFFLVCIGVCYFLSVYMYAILVSMYAYMCSTPTQAQTHVYWLHCMHIWHTYCTWGASQPQAWLYICSTASMIVYLFHSHKHDCISAAQQAWLYICYTANMLE
jgi:hypothetical protein